MLDFLWLSLPFPGQSQLWTSIGQAISGASSKQQTSKPLIVFSSTAFGGSQSIIQASGHLMREFIEVTLSFTT